MRRQLIYLQAINKLHLLVVVFFKNTELEDFKMSRATTVQDIFDKTIAEKYSYEQKLIAQELKSWVSKPYSHHQKTSP